MSYISDYGSVSTATPSLNDGVQLQLFKDRDATSSTKTLALEKNIPRDLGLTLQEHPSSFTGKDVSSTDTLSTFPNPEAAIKARNKLIIIFLLTIVLGPANFVLYKVSIHVPDIPSFKCKRLQ
jgi:hypothetical protein